MNKSQLLSLLLIIITSNLLVAQSIQRPKNNCSSLREKNENYGVGDDNKSWCDFEKQTPYVSCQCKWENELKNYEKQKESIINEIDNLSSKSQQVFKDETDVASKGNNIWNNLEDDDPNFNSIKANALSYLKEALNYAEERQRISKDIDNLRSKIYTSNSSSSSKVGNIEYFESIISQIESKTQPKQVEISSDNENLRNSNNTSNSNQTSNNTNNKISTPQSRLNESQNQADIANNKIRQQQEIDKAYQNDISNSLSESIDSDGNINATSFINSLPTATTKTQAYSNLIMSGTAILVQILQSTPSQEELRQQEIANRRIQLKDGIGKYDNNNNKTGHWTYFYMNTTAPKSSGSYQKGKMDGIWEIYENQDFDWAMDKIMSDVIVFDNGQIKERYKAENANYNITKETGLFSRKQNFKKARGNFIIDSNNNKLSYTLSVCFI